MGKKALFFDVDGTLLSEKTRQIPESALNALKEAREQGHMIFINSGRVRCLMDNIVDLVETDGILCGCGTQLIVHGETVYESRLDEATSRWIKDLAFQHGVGDVLEAQEACYFPPKERCPVDYLQTVKENLSRHVGADIIEDDENHVFDKFCFWYDKDSDTEGFVKKISSRFEVLDRGKSMYECVPLGHSKGQAIDKILEIYGIALEDAYVFGDSVNDLSMFQYAKNAVLMGEHDKELEPYASFVTRDVEDDGVAYAMKELGII